MTIRALLVDDHAMLREGLRAILARDPRVEVVGEATNGLDALEVSRRLHPDVVVMDIGMERMNGIEATRQILSRIEGCRVIALSVHADKRYVQHMLRAGASGYVLKEAACGDLVQAITTVAGGERYFSPRIDLPAENGKLPASPSLDAEGAYARLTPREREVLKLLSEGETSREIAGLLDISPRTVETHRRNIMRKLGLHSVAGLTKYAIREGLTSVER